MHNPLTYYTDLAKRWAWLVILGVIICGGAVYGMSKLVQPTYQATATIVVNFGGAGTNAPFENTSAALAALPTYAQLVTSPAVLNPVVAQHPGITLKGLEDMLSVKAQSNTQLITVDVKHSNPQFAMQIANQVSQSFAQFANTQTQLPGNVQVLSAQLPVESITPKPLLDGGIGALVGFALAIALIMVFEWKDDRLFGLDEVRDLLGLEALAVIPHLSRQERNKHVEETPALAEACRTLCANLTMMNVTKPQKLLMVTSALESEGKSTVAANLASFLAAAGRRVLLVDANLRNPALDQHFQLDNDRGLASAFLEMWARVDVDLNGQKTEVPNLRVLTAGTLPANSADLLQSPLAQQIFEQFRKAPFDHIIFDTPPLFPVADAQIIASYVQAIVLVVDVSSTPRKVLLRAKQLLNRTGTNILGMVVNKSSWVGYDDIRKYTGNLHLAKSNVTMTALSPTLQNPYPRTEGLTLTNTPLPNVPNTGDLADLDTVVLKCVRNR